MVFAISFGVCAKLLFSTWITSIDFFVAVGEPAATLSLEVFFFYPIGKTIFRPPA